jgi:hypothetical protein
MKCMVADENICEMPELIPVRALGANKLCNFLILNIILHILAVYQLRTGLTCYEMTHSNDVLAFS